MICRHCHGKKKITFQPSKTKTTTIKDDAGQFSGVNVERLVGFGPKKEIKCPKCG